VLVPSKKALEPILDGKGGLRFDHSADELDTLAEDFFSYGHSEMKEIINLPGDKRTFENTMIPFAQLDADTMAFTTVLGFYSSVASDKKLRKASEDVSKKFTDFWNEIYSSKELYEAVNAVKLSMHEAGTWEELAFEDRRLVNKMLIEYVRSGILLT
jgi:Zn-dependent oligopeptidase